jgi:iron complex outermembrane receptor protein
MAGKTSLLRSMLWASAAGAALLAAGGAQAQSAAKAEPGAGVALSEVIVTATKSGATQLQRTPITISAFSADQLDQSNSHNIRDLVQLTPGLNVSQVTASASLYIRGIGSNNVSAGSDPDVTTEIDGVYQARPYEQFTDYLDVERVEILRGPQGTLYGRNAIGGVVNVISRAPTNVFHAEQEITVGNYGLVQDQTYVSGPLVGDVLDASFSANYIGHSAYLKNIVPGQPGVGNANHGGARLQLRYRPNDRIDATTRVFVTELDERLESFSNILAPVSYAPLATGIIGDYTKVALNTPQTNRVSTNGVSEEIKVKINDALSFKSLTAYQYAHYNTQIDTDATEVTAVTTVQSDTDRQFSQEFDLTAHLARFDGVAGVYYFSDTETTLAQTRNPPSPQTPAAKAVQVQAVPSSSGQSEAVFAQGTYALSDTVRLTAGARYTSDRKHLDEHFDRFSLTNFPTVGAELAGFPFVASASRNSNAVTPMGNISWQATPNAMLYASITKGYKSGGTNYAASNPAALTFAPETIVSYEAGLKSEWWDNRVRFNAVGFHYDYSNLQVQSLIGAGVVSIGNAATAKVDGAEFEFTAKPTPQWLFSANLALLDAKYGSFPASSVATSLVGFVRTLPKYSTATQSYNAAGNYLNAAPRSSYSLAAQYTQPISAGEIFGRAEYYWQDRVFYDPTNAPISSQKAYSLVNLELGYTSPDKLWQAAIIAKNLADTHYLIAWAANGVIPSGAVAPPRTVMLQVSRKW